MSLFDFFKTKKTMAPEPSFIEQDIQLISNTEVIESNNSKNKLEFVDSSELIFASLPIKLAKEVPINSRKYVENLNKKFTFPLCPGMFDYSKLGYIVTSWIDFHFKVNKAGCAIVAGGGAKGNPFTPPRPMDSGIVEGLFKLEDGIPLKPYNLSSPWKVFSYDKDISALILPAWFHSDPEFLENFYVYPGIVDYNSFHVINLILAARKKCQYTIKAGDPILHVIPFYNKHIECGYGPPTVEQKSILGYDPKMYEKQFYRKNHSIKKNYDLKENMEQQVNEN